MLPFGVRLCPIGPDIPCGMPKLNIAALVEPALVTVAGVPGVKVVVLPASTVAASPCVPGGPGGPPEPVGIPKSKMAA